MNKQILQAERAARPVPCFSYAAGHNDGNGQTIWRYVYDHEVVAFTGRSWADLSREERDEVVHLFGQH